MTGSPSTGKWQNLRFQGAVGLDHDKSGEAGGVLRVFWQS